MKRRFGGELRREVQKEKVSRMEVQGTSCLLVDRVKGFLFI